MSTNNSMTQMAWHKIACKLVFSRIFKAYDLLCARQIVTFILIVCILYRLQNRKNTLLKQIIRFYPVVPALWSLRKQRNRAELKVSLRKAKNFSSCNSTTFSQNKKSWEEIWRFLGKTIQYQKLLKVSQMARPINTLGVKHKHLEHHHISKMMISIRRMQGASHISRITSKICKNR